jgi:glycosyltransferase involved in cell wall biosynthesis
MAAHPAAAPASERRPYHPFRRSSPKHSSRQRPFMIVHFTTVHPRTDPRIRSKMVASLHERFPGQVTMFVQDGLGDETDAAGFRIVDTGPPLSRVKRIILGGWRMFRAVLRASPVLAHFHDPELLPWGVLLRLFGIKVVYDVHEDYTQTVTQNGRLPPLARKILPPVVWGVEFVLTRLISGVVLVAPHQKTLRFPDKTTTYVRNWPKIDEFDEPNKVPMRNRPRECAYIGTVTLNRNIVGMMEAFKSERNSGAILRVAGQFTVPIEEAEAKRHPCWKDVRFDGWVSREGVADILGATRAGLVLLRPIPHEMVSYPIKLFEYLAAGVPVIASNFPLWVDLIGDINCCLFVDPLDPDAIASAVRWIIEHPDEAQSMGMRGRQAALERFNWTREADELVRFYSRLNIAPSAA